MSTDYFRRLSPSLRIGLGLFATLLYAFLPMNTCMASGWTPFVSCTITSISDSAKTCAIASAAGRHSLTRVSFMRTSTPVIQGGTSTIPGANGFGAGDWRGSHLAHENAWLSVAAICRWSMLSITWITNGVPANGPNIFSYSGNFQTGSSQGFLNLASSNCASAARALASAISFLNLKDRFRASAAMAMLLPACRCACAARSSAAATFSSESLWASPPAIIARPIIMYSNTSPRPINAVATRPATRSHSSWGNHKSAPNSITIPQKIQSVAAADARSKFSSALWGSFVFSIRALRGNTDEIVRRRRRRLAVSLIAAFVLLVLVIILR